VEDFSLPATKRETADNGTGDSLQKNTLQSGRLPHGLTALFKGTAAPFPTSLVLNTFPSLGSDGKQILKKIPARH
jgi:hypothetical protein